MLFNNIKIGDRIEITLKKSMTAQAFISQVEEIGDDNAVIAVMPIFYGQIVKLPVAETCSALFFTQSGMIKFDAVVTKYFKDGNINLMEMKIKSGGERIQRREFFRYDIVLPLRFALLSSDPEVEAEFVGHEEMYEGIIKDMSAGGLRFVSNADVPEKTRCKCFVMLGDDCVLIIGMLIRKQHFPKSNYHYQYRVRFVGLTSEEEEKIVQFIFGEQRKELLKQRAEARGKL